MKSFKLIILLIVAMTFCSCATIRFGRTTTVTIETEHPGDVVDILAIGPKKTVDIQQVTLPYKYKVRHNNLPQRLDIVSENYIYDPLTIGAVHKGEMIGDFCKIFGWTEGTVMTGLGVGLSFVEGMGGIMGCAPFWGAGLVLGGGLLAIGYTAETDIPDSNFYLTSSIPVDSLNYYQLEGWYLRQKALEDVYTLLSLGDYKLSKAKASFLIDYEPTAELFYLRGISSYYLGEHKKALKDLNEALYRLNFEINPGLSDEVIECISAVERSVALKKEKRNQMWAQIAGTVLQAGAEAYSMYQQAELVKYRQNHGMTASGMVIDPSKLSAQEVSMYFDPNLAIQQVMSEEMQQYQEFCRYNKKPDGSNYTLGEFQAFQGQAIQLAKENGYDIIAEQQRQHKEDRQWQAEQNRKSKESWFRRYGYDISSKPSPSETTSSTTSTATSKSTTSSYSSDNNNLSNTQSTSSKQEDEKKLDSKQQFKSEAVSSEDYKTIKPIDLYYRDGEKARKMNISAELCKKGALMYVKIGNKYYPRMYPNWQRFKNAIAYGERQLYYND